MEFDFSSYQKASAEKIDTDTDLFRGNRWISRPKDSKKIFRYRELLKRVRDDSGPATAFEYTKRLCRGDLYYLAHQVLGFRDLYEPLHGDFCDFLVKCDDMGFSTLTEMPRSHYKSSIATTARSIRWMILDPSVTIGLGSATLKDCRPFGADIKGLLEKCEALQKLFPEIFYSNPKKQSEKWTAEEFTIKRMAHIREATVTLFGLEDDLPTGKHFKKILLDDIINRENINTPERMKKIEMNANLLQPLKVVLTDPTHFVGTPYHLFDYYAKLEKHQSTKVYIRQVYEHGVPSFPTKFSKESLDQLRIDYGNYLFNTQYMMIRQSSDDKKFDRNWLKFSKKIKPYEQGYAFFLAVDPASARRKDSDFTAMVVIACDWKMNFYLVDGLHDKLNPLQRIESVFDFCRKWGIRWVSYETIGFQKTDEFFIIQKQREKKFYFQIFPVDKHKVSKDDRIEGLQPIMASGRFFVPEFYVPKMGEPESMRIQGIPYKRKWASPDDGYGLTIDVVEQVALEMDFYPQSAHDDLLDVLAQARSVVYAGSIPLPKEAPRRANTAYGRPKPKAADHNPMTG